MDNSMQYNFTVQNLGECTIPSPVTVSYFTSNEKRILFSIYLNQYDHFKSADGRPLSVEVAGPREKIFFDPSKTKAAIVTCGGLCPGINDVIRTLVMELHHRYGVRNIVGIKYGFQGLDTKIRPSYCGADTGDRKGYQHARWEYPFFFARTARYRRDGECPQAHEYRPAVLHWRGWHDEGHGKNHRRNYAKGL